MDTQVDNEAPDVSSARERAFLGMALSAAGMGFAAAGFLTPVAGTSSPARQATTSNVVA